MLLSLFNFLNIWHSLINDHLQLSLLFLSFLHLLQFLFFVFKPRWKLLSLVLLVGSPSFRDNALNSLKVFWFPTILPLPPMWLFMQVTSWSSWVQFTLQMLLTFRPNLVNKCFGISCLFTRSVWRCLIWIAACTSMPIELSPLISAARSVVDWLLLLVVDSRVWLHGSLLWHYSGLLEERFLLNFLSYSSFRFEIEMLDFECRMI